MTSKLFLAGSLPLLFSLTLATPQQFPLPAVPPSTVTSRSLQSSVQLDALLAHAHKLQIFAYSYPENNRLFGGDAHNDTIQYIYDTVSSLDFYNVTLQPFSQYAYIEGTFSLCDTHKAPVPKAALFSYSPNGDVKESLVQVDNMGCELSDFPTSVSGKIALISRGDCSFGQKVVKASLSGVKAVVIYDNSPGGPIAGTLGPPQAEAPFVPALSIPQATGLDIIKKLESGEDVMLHLVVKGSTTEQRSTHNVIAETLEGDKQNVLHVGAHSDSVSAGPGINDNGSGSITLLEIAIQLARFKVNNAVRFSWWSAEEQGLIGSTYYVETASRADLEPIRLYLNFDMTASPNYVLGTYDGDGARFGIRGPPGSAEAKHLFEAHFKSVGLNSTSSEFNGRSDYGPFLEAGIACGGLDTGAEGIKTEEEAAMFGGEANVAYDVNYHQRLDTVDNLSLDALEANAKAIAHAVATYSTSFETLPAKGVREQSMSPSKFLWRGSYLIA